MSKRRKKKQKPEHGLTPQEIYEASQLYGMMVAYGIPPEQMDPADLVLIDRYLAAEDASLALDEYEDEHSMTVEEYHQAMMLESQYEREMEGSEDEPQLPLDFDHGDEMGKKHRRRQMFNQHNDKWARGFSSSPERNSLVCPPSGLIKVVRPDGSAIISFRIDQRDAWWFRNARMAYPDAVERVGDEDVISIPVEQCKNAITTTTPTWSSCTFDSTKDYCKSLFGIELHQTDRDWMSRHPYAEEMGVPQEYTPVAIQQLLEPYGLGVARIRVRAGSWFTGDALQQWMFALGVNGKAMTDHETSNVAAAEELGMTVAEADQLYRFEFEPDPLRPSILGERADLTISSGANGKRGGHARYLAPRQGNGQWFISLQLDWLKNIEYNTPLVLPEYVPRADALKLNFYQVKVPNAPDVDHISWYHKWVQAGSPGKVDSPESEAVVVPIRPTAPPSRPPSSTASGDSSTARIATDRKSLMDITFDPNEQVAKISHLFERMKGPGEGGVKFRCQSCDKWRDIRLLVEGLEEVCMGCYIESWTRWSCPNPKCQVHFDAGHLPIIHTDGLCWSCPRCAVRMKDGTDPEVIFLSSQIITTEQAVKLLDKGGQGLVKVTTIKEDGTEISHFPTSTQLH